MATADNTNVLGSFLRAFQQGRQGVRDRQRQDEQSALNEQIKQIQLLTAQRQLAEILKTPEQRAREALTSQLITDAVKGGGVRAAPIGLEGEDIALPAAIGQTERELALQGLASPVLQTSPLSISSGVPNAPTLSNAISELVAPSLAPATFIAPTTGVPMEFETPVPGVGGAFVNSPVLARENQALELARATALAGARRSPVPPGFQLVTDENGFQSLVQVRGAGAGTGAVTPLTGPGGEPVKAPPKASTGSLTQGQQNSLLEKAAKNGVNVEEFRDSTTGQIDYQNLSIKTGQAEGEGVRAENAIRNARLAASASKGGKTTASQENFQLYGSRLEQADKALQSLSDKGFDPTSIGTEGLIGQWIPNLLKSSDRQSYEQAQRNFINAVLRKESGAVISESEFENARAQYFPQPGDSADVLTQKAATRKIVIDEFKRLGSPGDSTPAPSATPPPANGTGRTPAKDPLGVF